jgi:predicted dehydrogenase
LKILIVGAGLIGKDRITALKKISSNYSMELDITVVDKNEKLLDEIKDEFKLQVNNNFNDELVNNPDWIFICTPHSVAPDLLIDSFNYCKNILVEKPLGRNLEECNKILEAKSDDINLYVGYNYRFYLGINLLLNHVKNNFFGDLISVNMILGHGNSPGMENTWKLDPIMCGGGCLIDPGVHLLDIALSITNSELKVNGGSFWKGFWKTGIEEEAHIILEDNNNVIFNIQTSLNR